MRAETTERLLIGLILAAIGLAAAGGVVVVSALSVLLIPIPFAILGAAVVAGVTLHEPKWGLLIALAMMPYERLMALFPVEGEQQGFLSTLTVTKVVLLMVVPIWLIRILLLKDSSVFRKTFSTPSPIVALIFAFYTMLSLVNASSTGAFVKNWSTNVSNVVLFVLVLNLMDDKKWVLRSIWVLWVGYVIVGFMGVFEVATGTHVLELMGHEMPEQAFVLYADSFRPAGPSGDPDYFAASIIFGLMLTLGVWRFVKFRLFWGFLLIFAGVFMFNIFATGSRGAMLGFLVAMAAFWWFLEMPNKGITVTLVVVGGFSFFVLYSVAVSARTAGRYTGEETKSLEYRLGWQAMSFGMIEAKPLLGVGMGNHVMNQRYFFDPRPPRKQLENSANTYLQLAAEAGIPALFLFVAFFWLVLLFLIKVILRCDDPETRHLATCLFAALLGYFVFAGTAHGLYNEVAWTLHGLAVGLGNSARDPAASAGIARQLGESPARSLAPSLNPSM